MIKAEDITEIGKFQKTHALKGELNMLCDIDPQYFLEGNPLIIYYDGLAVPFYAETIRKKGSTSFLIKLDGIDSEEEASSFVNKKIYMLKKDAPEWLEEDEFEEGNLIGFALIDSESGKTVGIIEDEDYSTMNALLIVKTPEEETLYIPLSENLIEEVDEDKKIIKMNLPEGLLDINN